MPPLAHACLRRGLAKFRGCAHNTNTLGAPLVAVAPPMEANKAVSESSLHVLLIPCCSGCNFAWCNDARLNCVHGCARSGCPRLAPRSMCTSNGTVSGYSHGVKLTESFKTPCHLLCLVQYRVWTSRFCVLANVHRLNARCLYTNFKCNVQARYCTKQGQRHGVR